MDLDKQEKISKAFISDYCGKGKILNSYELSIMVGSYNVEPLGFYDFCRKLRPHLEEMGISIFMQKGTMNPENIESIIEKNILARISPVKIDRFCLNYSDSSECRDSKERIDELSCSNRDYLRILMNIYAKHNIAKKKENKFTLQ